MGRRNWCQSEIDPATGELVWDIRVEKQKGLGETVGYVFAMHLLLPVRLTGDV